MLIVDIIILILLFGFFIRGWQSGLIRMLAGLIGILTGIIVAGNFYPFAAEWLMELSFFEQRENLSNIISMVIIFLAVNGLIGVGAYLIDRFFHVFSFIPFLKTINKLGGAIVGLLAGAFIFGFLISMFDKFPFADFITQYLQQSQVVPYLIVVTELIMPLWPQAINQIQGKLNLN